jgi:hypothetical protein
MPSAISWSRGGGADAERHQLVACRRAAVFFDGSVPAPADGTF